MDMQIWVFNELEGRVVTPYLDSKLIYQPNVSILAEEILNATKKIQAFINYNFWYTRFRALKSVLGARLCTHVKYGTCTLLVLIWYDSKNCTKLVLKALAAKNSLSISVLYTAPFL